MAHRPILVLAVWALTAAPAVAAEGPYPVWLSPSLGVERLEDVPAMLDAPLFRPRHMRNWSSRMYPEDDPVHRIQTCNHVLDALHEGRFKDLRELRLPIYECTVLAWVAKAQPSQVSFVREFRLDHNAPHDLPGTINFDHPNCNTAVKLYQAHRAGQSLADVVDNRYARFSSDEFNGIEIDLLGSVTLLDAGQIYVETDPRRLWHHTPTFFMTGRPVRPGQERAAIYADAWAHHMEIVARADFTDDGVEDLLIYMQSASSRRWLKGDIYEPRSVFVLTRDRRDAVLRVVDIAKFLATVCEAGCATFEETLAETESAPDALPPAPASAWRP